MKKEAETRDQRIKVGVCVNLLPGAVPGPLAPRRGQCWSGQEATGWWGTSEWTKIRKADHGLGIFTVVFFSKVQTNAVCTELVKERAPTAPIPLPLTFAETFSHRSYEICAFLIFWYFWCVQRCSINCGCSDYEQADRAAANAAKEVAKWPWIDVFLYIDDLGCVERLLPFLVFSWLGRDALRRHAAVTWQLPFSCHGLPQLLDPNATHHST